MPHALKENSEKIRAFNYNRKLVYKAVYDHLAKAEDELRKAAEITGDKRMIKLVDRVKTMTPEYRYFWAKYQGEV